MDIADAIFVSRCHNFPNSLTKAPPCHSREFYKYHKQTILLRWNWHINVVKKEKKK
ncbi:hypothetical protein Hanom_Chr14g01245751 [Helianthus anomalus]